MNKTKVVFVAGTSHSGSTLLDKIIGSHPNGRSLGEIHLTYQKFKINPAQFDTLVCSCGELGNNCDFWKNIFQEWSKHPSQNYTQAYLALIDYFQLTQNKDAFIVDSSKYLPALERIESNINIDIYGIHLVKDMRSYLVSQIDRARQKGKYQFWAPLKHARSWYFQNRKIHNYCLQSNLKFMQLGYEELCLYTDASMADICNFIDEKPMDSILNTDKGHILTGNSMRLAANKSTVQYDYRWFNRKDWVIPYFIWKRARKFNEKMVYSKRYDQIFKREKLKK